MGENIFNADCSSSDVAPLGPLVGRLGLKRAEEQEQDCTVGVAWGQWAWRGIVGGDAAFLSWAVINLMVL